MHKKNSFKRENERTSISAHLSAFSQFQIVALRLEEAYLRALVESTPFLIEQIVLAEDQFRDLFKRIFKHEIKANVDFKSLVEIVCESARSTSGYITASLHIH